MPAYQFLGISTNQRDAQQADALIHGTDGKKTCFNHEHFKGIEVGTHFVMDHNVRWPNNPVKVITEEEIPAILQKDKEDLEEARRLYEEKKAANIATGRFKYWYTDFREGKAENILEFLTDDYEQFWQVLCDNLNSGERVSGKPREMPVTVEQMKKDERFVKFMDLAKPGDKLEWYSWNGGFLAYSAGPHITRGEECVAYQPWIVS